MQNLFRFSQIMFLWKQKNSIKKFPPLFVAKHLAKLPNTFTPRFIKNSLESQHFLPRKLRDLSSSENQFRAFNPNFT